MPVVELNLKGMVFVMVKGEYKFKVVFDGEEIGFVFYEGELLVGMYMVCGMSVIYMVVE